MNFPTYMYHKTKGTQVFKSKEELDSAGSGWVDSPAKIDETKLKEPEDKYLGIEDLKKDEILNILVEEYDQEFSDLKKLNKPELLLMLKGFKGN